MVTPTPKPRRPRVYDHLLATLGRAILSGTYGPGSVLPNEDQLCRRYRVGRNSLREAARVLAAKGLLEARPRIGTCVCQRGTWNLLDAEVMSWGRGTEAFAGFIAGLTQARMALEPAAAALAAERGTLSELAGIEAACERMANSRKVLDATADVDFHIAVLVASGNEVFIQLGRVLREALLNTFTETSSWLPPEVALGYHRAVLEAIRLRHPEQARQAMLRLLSPITAATGHTGATKRRERNGA